MFGHPNSTVVLLPYSSHVAYINHDSTKFNAKLQWATNFSGHNEYWLYKDTVFLEQQWRAGRFNLTKFCKVEERVDPLNGLKFIYPLILFFINL